MDGKMLKFSDLIDKGVPYCRVSLDRLEKLGKFPRRRYLGPKKIYWVEEEIDAWVAQFTNIADPRIDRQACTDQLAVARRIKDTAEIKEARAVSKFITSLLEGDPDFKALIQKKMQECAPKAA
jgi:hypothetical protein